MADAEDQDFDSMEPDTSKMRREDLYFFQVKQA